MAVPILQREVKPFGGSHWFSCCPFIAVRPIMHGVLLSSSSLFLPPRAALASQFGLGFLRVREKSMHRRGEQPLALVVFFRVTQEVADRPAHHARPRPPAPPPPVVPVGHLPAVPQRRGRADGVGAAQAGGHGGFEGERLLLATVRRVGVFVQGQVGLRDVALRGAVLALLPVPMPVPVPGARGLRQAGLRAPQRLRGQRGAPLASVGRRGDAP